MQSLEKDFDVIYATNYFLDEEELKKTLNSLTSISLAKAYYHFFEYRHIGCWCWRCKLQNKCLQLILKRGHNEFVLIGKKWKIKNDYDN